MDTIRVFTALVGAPIAGGPSNSFASAAFRSKKSTWTKIPTAEELVLRVNDGRRKVPTLEVDGRYFACSPFDAEQLAAELKIPLNP